MPPSGEYMIYISHRVCARWDNNQNRISMDLEKILSLVKVSAALGAAELNRVHLPDDDRITRAELLRHLRRNGVDYPEKWVKHYESEGSICRHKKGERNSKVTYSLCEVQRLLVAEKINSIHIR